MFITVSVVLRCCQWFMVVWCTLSDHTHNHAHNHSRKHNHFGYYCSTNREKMMIEDVLRLSSRYESDPHWQQLLSWFLTPVSLWCCIATCRKSLKEPRSSCTTRWATDLAPSSFPRHLRSPWTIRKWSGNYTSSTFVMSQSVKGPLWPI